MVIRSFEVPTKCDHCTSFMQGQVRQGMTCKGNAGIVCVCVGGGGGGVSTSHSVTSLFVFVCIGRYLSLIKYFTQFVTSAAMSVVLSKRCRSAPCLLAK